MKIFPFILLLSSPVLLFGQNTTLDSTYLLVTQDFKIAKLEETIHFKSGGISLINSAQLNAMEEIVDLVNKNQFDEAINLTLEENEKKIEACNSLYEKLLINSEKSQEISNKSLQLTKSSLEEISASLESTKIALGLANENVASSQELIKKYRSAKIWQNVLIGLAGVGVGVIITR